MGGRTDETTEIIALAILRQGVRGHEIGGGAVTYRRSLPGVVPGQRLTISVEKRWTFRKTPMLGGPLLHAGLSLRALQQAGFELPQRGPHGLVSPGDGDGRLREGVLADEAGDWAVARALFVDVLERHPACLLAHAAMGRLLGGLEHRATALAHLTAAVRLGMGALASEERPLPLDAGRETERALLHALVDRASLLEAIGRTEDAAADLRRALAWDPTDVAGAAALLSSVQGRLEEPAAAPGGRRS